MTQQITSNTQASAPSKALQGARGNDSGSKGIFGKLLAILESKGDAENGSADIKKPMLSLKGAMNAGKSTEATADAETENAALKSGLKSKGEKGESIDVSLIATESEINNELQPKRKLFAAKTTASEDGDVTRAEDSPAKMDSDDAKAAMLESGNGKVGVKGEQQTPSEKIAMASADNQPKQNNAARQVKPEVEKSAEKSSGQTVDKVVAQRSESETAKATERSATQAANKAVAHRSEPEAAKSAEISSTPSNRDERTTEAKGDAKATATLAAKADTTTPKTAATNVATRDDATIKAGAMLQQNRNTTDNTLPVSAMQESNPEETIAMPKADLKEGTKQKAVATAAQTADSDIEQSATIAANTSTKSAKLQSKKLNERSEPRVEIKMAAQQPSAAMQPEKVAAATSEEGAVAAVASQPRISTNSFVKSRRINLESVAKAKTASQSATEKRPEIMVGQQRPASEPFMGSMKEMLVQADGGSRQGLPSFDGGNAQPFQISGMDTSASTLARPSFQSHLPTMASGPWSVASAMQQVGIAAGQGQFQLELTLTPAHLGKVQVFLESDANKQIQVHFVVDQAASRQSIEQHLPSLRQALAEQGLNMDSFSMESSAQHQEKQQNGNRREAAAPTTIASNVSGNNETQRSEAATDGRLSIRV